MQTLVIEGYLAADPSILTAQGSGRKRASFRLLETTRYRRADGEPGERTTGFNCVCFNEATAENYIAPYARKGSRVVIQGHIENDTWTGKDGGRAVGKRFRAGCANGAEAAPAGRASGHHSLPQRETTGDRNDGPYPQGPTAWAGDEDRTTRRDRDVALGHSEG